MNFQTQKLKELINRRYHLIIFIAVMLAATILRLYQLNSGLWLDEILTYTLYAKMPFLKIISIYDSENQNFLYSLLAHASILIFGDSNWALRFPAVLFGLGSILMVYLFGREVAGNREAVLSSALITFSYHHVWFSQNARGYTGLLFWTMLSSYWLLGAIRINSRFRWFLYAVGVALGIYTHLTMIFVWIGQFCVFLYHFIWHGEHIRTSYWRGLIYGFLGAGVIAFFLMSPALTQILATVGGSEVSVVSEWKSPIWTAIEILKGLSIGFSSVFLAAGALLLFIAGLISYKNSYPEVVILLLVPSFVGALIVVAIGHHLWPRFFFFVFGFGVFIVIRGALVIGGMIGRLFNLNSQQRDWVGLVLCLVLILTSAASVPFAYGPKQDYDGALNFVENTLEEGDSIVAVGLAEYVYREFLGTDWDKVNSVDELEAIRSHSQRNFVLYTFRPVLEALQPDILQRLESEYKLVRIFDGTVAQGEIYLYVSE